MGGAADAAADPSATETVPYNPSKAQLATLHKPENAKLMAQHQQRMADEYTQRMLLLEQGLLTCDGAIKLLVNYLQVRASPHRPIDQERDYEIACMLLRELMFRGKPWSNWAMVGHDSYAPFGSSGPRFNALGKKMVTEIRSGRLDLSELGYCSRSRHRTQKECDGEHHTHGTRCSWQVGVAKW